MRYIFLFVLILISCSSEKGLRKKNTVYPKNAYSAIPGLFKKYSCTLELRKKRVPLDERLLVRWNRYSKFIKSAYRGKINFAGKYVIVQWGCGTECQTGIVMNVFNGTLVSLPTSERGIEYHNNSLLLIVNPPSKTHNIDTRPSYAYPAYYLWDDSEFVLLHDTRG